MLCRRYGTFSKKNTFFRCRTNTRLSIPPPFFSSSFARSRGRGECARRAKCKSPSESRRPHRPNGRIRRLLAWRSLAFWGKKKKVKEPKKKAEGAFLRSCDFFLFPGPAHTFEKERKRAKGERGRRGSGFGALKSRRKERKESGSRRGPLWLVWALFLLRGLFVWGRE